MPDDLASCRLLVSNYTNAHLRCSKAAESSALRAITLQFLPLLKGKEVPLLLRRFHRCKSIMNLTPHYSYLSAANLQDLPSHLLSTSVCSIQASSSNGRRSICRPNLCGSILHPIVFQSFCDGEDGYLIFSLPTACLIPRYFTHFRWSFASSGRPTSPHLINSSGTYFSMACLVLSRLLAWLSPYPVTADTSLIYPAAIIGRNRVPYKKLSTSSFGLAVRPFMSILAL